MSKFSIILPLRNSGNYLNECINSILAQTYTDFEILILAHDSDESTLSYLNKLTDSRIRIIYAENIDGIAGNWARIKDIVKSEYMTIIGYDDILYPNFLQTINRLIAEYPDATLYHTHFNFIDSKGKIIRACKSMPEKLQLTELLEGFLNNTIDSMGTGYVMRSADYDKIGGISINYPSLLFADFDLWLQLTALGYEVIAHDNCFAFRVHQSVTSSSADDKLHKGLETFIDFLAKLKERDAACSKVIEEYCPAFLLRLTKSYSHRILRTPKSKRADISVINFVTQTIQFAEKVGVEKKYTPTKNRSIIFSNIIDNSSLLSRVFLLIHKYKS